MLNKTPSIKMSTKSKLSKAFLFMGIFIFLLGCIGGYPSVKHSIEFGMETKKWPSTNLHSTSLGTTRRADYCPGWAQTESSWATYRYKVNGVWYSSGRYDVNGNSFFGSGSTVSGIRKKFNSGKINKIYYNPEDPSDSVIVPGISISLETRMYIRRCLFGVFLVLLGLLKIHQEQQKMAREIV